VKRHESHEETEGEMSRRRFFIRCSLFGLVVPCLVYLLFFHRLADRDLWSSHEARAAMDAQTILDEGDWGLPHLYDGRLELQKPPLYYWLVALLARCRGGQVDAWAVRLPATLSAVGCVVGVFLLLWRRGRPLAGVLAAAILATALHFTWLARVGRIDMPLTLTVVIVLGGLYLVYRGGTQEGDDIAPPRGRPLNGIVLVMVYLALAAGLLLKGPVALVLPVVAMGLHLLLERELPAPWRLGRWRQLINRLGLWWGLSLALGLAATWFVWANAETHSELWKTFFWHHNLDRALGETALGRRDHPWWLYGPLFFWDFLPWSVLLPAAAWLFWRRGGWADDPEARFGAAWLGGMLIVLSCVAFKRSDYLLPAYPGAALLLGCAGERWYLASAHRPRLAAALVTVLAGCVIGWGVYFQAILPEKDLALEYQRFAAEVRMRAPAPQLVSFFRTESHALAFHVGRPLAIFVEWERLEAEMARSETSYIVMPIASLAECDAHLPPDRFEKLLTSTDLPGCKHNKPLVLLRTRPPMARARADESADAGSATTAPDRHAAAQRPVAGRQ
jgi:4-amino-4-deoxy-L-arabinose transferase-like glycosyltransferase